MTEQQQKLYDKLLKKVNEYCLGAAAEDVIEAIDDLVESYETPKVDPAVKPLENLKELEVWATNGYTACDVEKAKELVKPIESSLKALEILKKYITIEETGYDLFPYSINENQYTSVMNPNNIVTKEEYELLKEVLK